jgi:outer membrane protein, heavy metal efflux system
MNKIIIIFVMMVSNSLAQSLEDYLKIAEENNPGLRSSYATYEASLEKIPQVNSLEDPTMSAGYFVSPIESRLGPQNAKLSVNQMFPWWGTLEAKEEVAGSFAKSKYQDYLDKKNALFFEVKKAYYPIFEINNQLMWQRELLEILKTYKVFATTKFSNGTGTMVDVIRVDIIIDDVEIDIELLNDELLPLEVTFNKLLNRADNISVVVENNIKINNVEELYRKDDLLVNNPILRSIDFEFNAAQAKEKVAQKIGMPKIGLGIDYAFLGQRTDADPAGNGRDVVMPKLTFTLPIYRDRINASVKEAQLMQKSLDLRKQDVENNLLSSYQQSWFALVDARKKDLLYDNQIIQTEQAIDLLYSAYSNSGEEFDEVLRTQLKLLKYKISKATAIKKFYIALAKLDYLTAK